MKSIKVIFAPAHIEEIVLPSRIAPEKLMESLLEKGIEILQVSWLKLYEDKLAVEDDAIFLADAYNELEDFLQHGGKHFAYLGDGSLEINSTIENDTVSVSLRCTPHLDVQYMQFKTAEMTKEQYLSAWQNLMRQILKHLT